MRRVGGMQDPVEAAVERLRRIPGVTMVWWNCADGGRAGLRRDGRSFVASAATPLAALRQLEAELGGPPAAHRSALAAVLGEALELLREVATGPAQGRAATRPPAPPAGPGGRWNRAPPRSPR